MNILQSQMTSLELSVSGATIRSANLGSSIMILEASFTLIYDVYSTGITCDDRQLMIVISLQHQPQVAALVPDIFSNFNLLKNDKITNCNYKITNDSTATEARESELQISNPYRKLMIYV